MPKTTRLSSGTLNGHDQLAVHLIDENVVISWPSRQTITTQAAYDAMAATAMRILAAASTALAQRRARKRL